MPVSPRTQALMQPPPTEEDATLAFEDGFSQLAQRIFSAKFPELMGLLVTFKILNSDIDTGSAIGAFIMDVNGETVYVPVILSNNKIKPLEIMYFKDQDIFLPLNKEWLDEISRRSLDELGKGTTPPENLKTDQDIRTAVIPPTTGRFAFAAESNSGVKLAQFLAEAPNFVKKAFRIVLERNHDILKFAFEHFDKDALLEALRPHVEKRAESEESVTILTPEDEAARFREVFGAHAGKAWQEAVKVGYVIADSRKNVNNAVETEGELKLTNVSENGFYKIYMADGSRRLALVISKPQSLGSPFKAGKRVDLKQKYHPYRVWHKKVKNQLLEDEEAFYTRPNSDGEDRSWVLYFENGDIYETNKAPIGEWVPPESVSGSLARVMDNSRPVVHGYGIFVSFHGGKLSATQPVEIAKVTTGSDGVRRITTFDRKTLVTDPKDPIKQIVAPNNSNVVYLPANYKFLPGNPSADKIKLLEGAADTLSHIERLEKVGALKVKLIDAGAGMFTFGGVGVAPMSKLGMVSALVNDLGLRQGTAEKLLKKTASAGKTAFYLINDAQLHHFGTLTKIAQGMPPPGMPPGMPPGAAGMPPGMPPEAAGMPPGGAPAVPPEGAIPPEMAAAYAAPPPPPPPNPVELAVGDVEQQVMEQSAQVSQQLANEQRELSNKMNILQAVKERAQQISAEMNGVPTGAPAQVEQTPPGAAPPGMPMAPGAEEPNAAELANSAEGPMAEAAKLKDPEAFQATAIGALAANNSFRELIANYLPTLEESLDDLGRILMAVWLQEPTLQQEMGDDAYAKIEKQLITVFRNLGDLILKINQTAIPAEPEDEEIA